MANPPIPRYTYIFTIFREEATSTLAGFHASPMILVELEFGNVGFCGRKGKPDRNPPNKAGTERQTRIGGRRALSPLLYPCDMLEPPI